MYDYKYEVVYNKAFREELYDLIIDIETNIYGKLEFYTRAERSEGATYGKALKKSGTSNII
jgi:hypothetical protein